ncbi:phage tail sheath family protein [Pyxidicoccus parkwayensis]|uniref:Phage tail sheath family protein n=1 Tax=Pyxidicoccus parkwayensis TaxID=2813578 RepID=A0ABX7PAU8_9BACT|nr:phage tail sheath C-terminal domain-containing protein [Pyxidicoccus parkwaysis]QSQ27596.1 phage tail sheath family protein [Pyxidicoccus parkwaysis]
MPAALSYPGVYVEEIPSGVRAITGVPTSVTAFIGRALRGPTDDPIIVNGFGDFERIFGGLWVDSSLGYAVRDFFLNGGGQAIIVRLVGTGATSASITLSGITFLAASPGAWGNNLRISVDHDTKDPASTTLFNLTVTDTGTNNSERFLNLSSAAADVRFYPKVLEQSSKYVRVQADGSGNFPTTQPAVTASPVGPGTAAVDGGVLTEAAFTGTGKRDGKAGLYALEKADIFNLLCIPPYLATSDVDPSLVGSAASYCEERRAVLIVDPPSDWEDVKGATDGYKASPDPIGTRSKNAALYFPRLVQPNPLRENQFETFAPCGAVAGVISRTDTSRGVWKAPAGLDASLTGVPKLSVPLTDKENGQLNPLGINCLRSLPAAGRVVWGSRTLQGNDLLASEWKYLPVRRLALYIEESLYRGIQWVVFEPNDEPLWSQIRLNVGAFMQGLFRQGAFQGASPREAYFVKCDKETTTQDDINRGVVNIVVGFAPLKPAEFVVLKLQQMAGQSES